MFNKTAPVALGLIALCAPSTHAQCPPNSQSGTTLVSDSFGPFSGNFDTDLTIPRWNPADYPAGTQLVQIEMQVSTTLTSESQITNNGDAPCNGLWTASVGLDLEANAAVNTPAQSFLSQRSENFFLLPGGTFIVPLDVQNETFAPVIGSNPADIAAWTGVNPAVFDVQGETGTSTVSNCGTLVSNTILSAQIELTVRYTWCLAPNDPPVCVLGPQILSVPCAGPITTVQLDGSGSFDPEGQNLSFLWTSNCNNGFFDDPTSPTPTLILDSSSGCNVGCVVFLTLGDGTQRTSCHMRVFVVDAQAPDFQYDLQLTGLCGETDPNEIGAPVVTDACDPDPDVTFDDTLRYQSTCKTDVHYQTILRMWTAVDACQNTSMAAQQVIVNRHEVELDPIPGSCANLVTTTQCPAPLGLDGTEGIPDTIALTLVGSPDFDVSQVDLTTLEVSGWNCPNQPVAPIVPVGTQFIDESTFAGLPACECAPQVGDGTMDLRLEVARAAMVQYFHMDTLPAGTPVRVAVTGRLLDGCEFVAFGCVTTADCPPLD